MGIAEELGHQFGDFHNEAKKQDWLHAKRRLPMGSSICGQVISRHPFGVFVDIGIGFPALLSVPEFRDAGVMRYSNLEDFPEMHSKITGRIVWFNDRDREVILTQRQPHPLLDRA